MGQPDSGARIGRTAGAPVKKPAGSAPHPAGGRPPDADSPHARAAAQQALFELEDPDGFGPSPTARRPREERVEPVPVDADTLALADALGPHVHLGTSSWHFPGWQGLVWAGRHSSQTLSRRGLAAYAAHPLLRCVSLDRAFYRTLDADTYTGLAAQTPDDFRFVVKAPAVLTDAVLREPATGQAVGANPGFLDPEFAVKAVLRPAVRGLQARLGVLVLQLSPLPSEWRDDRARFHAALARCLAALQSEPERAPGHRIAVELRDPTLLSPDLSAVLRENGALYALGLHDRMPPAEDQLGLLRAQWPAPLVCRWNLRRGLRYDDARGRFEPFDRLQAPDETTRRVVARVAAATAAAGQPVFVTINNKAEGSAPQSVRALAKAIAAQASAGGTRQARAG